MESEKKIVQEKKKDNTSKPTIKSKIPIPLSHLPALPDRLLNRRRPLKVVGAEQSNNYIYSAGPSTSRETVSDENSRLRLDTRHVTVRQRNEELDWNFEVFKDLKDGKEPEIPIIVLSTPSSDDDCDTENASSTSRETVSDENSRLRLDTRHVTVRQRNEELDWNFEVFKDLKDGEEPENPIKVLSTSSSDDDCDTENASVIFIPSENTLRCRPMAELLQDAAMSDEFAAAKLQLIDQQYDSCVQLMNEETINILSRIPEKNRALVLNGLIRINGPNGDPSIVQTSIWYFDGLRSLPMTNLRTLKLKASTCFWIAQKLLGPENNASRLIEYWHNIFTKEDLIRTEKEVIYKLNLPRKPVVPQTFIRYYTNWLEIPSPEIVEIAATFICLTGQLVNINNLCLIYPSVIGAAAVKNALILLQEENLIERLNKCPLFKSAEKKYKKSRNMINYVCYVQRKAVRLVGDIFYDYTAPLEVYSQEPHYIAKRVLEACRNCYPK